MPAAVVGADFVVAGADFADEAAGGGVVAAGAAAGGVAAPVPAADLAVVDFCTPPWPLQAPLPVAAEVVPSLQVVGFAESAARLGIISAKVNNGAATAAMREVSFIKFTPFLMSRTLSNNES